MVCTILTCVYIFLGPFWLSDDGQLCRANMKCDGLEPTHGSQMIGEWEQRSDSTGSTMVSGCRESQFSKNSLNMYVTASEGESCAGDNLIIQLRTRVVRHMGGWGVVAGRGDRSGMCTVTAVWMTCPPAAQPKGYSRGQSSFGSLSPSVPSTQTNVESDTKHTAHLRLQGGTECPPQHIPACRVSPVDDLFTLGPDEMLRVGGQDAQRVLLTRPGLSVDDIRALVHVDCTLR